MTHRSQDRRHCTACGLDLKIPGQHNRPSSALGWTHAQARQRCRPPPGRSGSGSASGSGLGLAGPCGRSSR
jgi:hypothetical protein